MFKNINLKKNSREILMCAKKIKKSKVKCNKKTKTKYSKYQNINVCE